MDSMMYCLSHVQGPRGFPAPRGPLVSQDFLVSQDALGSMVPMHQDLQAFLVYLGRKDPPVFQVPR